MPELKQINMNIKKEDFQVYDKHLNNDGGAYKKLGKRTWYNDEMYQEALKQGQTLPIDSVSNSVFDDGLTNKQPKNIGYGKGGQMV